MASTLDSRLGQLEEQGKTLADATRRLLETVNAVKDTGELLLQMIENHQKMLEMSRRVENLINDVKTEVKVETINDEEEDWGDNSPPTTHPSADWDAEADDMPFYIPVQLNSRVCGVLHVVVAPEDVHIPKNNVSVVI